MNFYEIKCNDHGDDFVIGKYDEMDVYRIGFRRPKDCLDVNFLIDPCAPILPRFPLKDFFSSIIRSVKILKKSTFFSLSDDKIDVNFTSNFMYMLEYENTAIEVYYKGQGIFQLDKESGFTSVTILNGLYSNMGVDLIFDVEFFLVCLRRMSKKLDDHG